MKGYKNNLNSLLLTSVILAGSILLLASCKKYNYAGFTPGKAAPTITSVHTLGLIDTSTVTTIISKYDADANKVETEKQRANIPYAFDSTVTEGSLNGYYIIYGTNLGSTTKITFNGMEAYFNRAMITDGSIIVKVPSKTPFFGSEATDSLVITTLYGQAYYKFEILPPPPTVEDYSDFNFYEGSRITLDGMAFSNVSAISFTGIDDSETPLTIVSQSENVIVVQFPAIGATKGNLTFTYNLTGVDEEITDDQELVNIDQAYQFFIDDFMNDWVMESWSGAAKIETDPSFVKTGTASFMGFFSKGGWKLEGFKRDVGGFDYDPSYQYLSFWVKGGTSDQIVNIETNTSADGFGQNEINPITVPANVWTYFNIPLSSIDFWSPGSTLTQFAFFIKGPDDADQQLYFDDVILIK